MRRPTSRRSRFSDEVTVINSFSKYYCMTGWRVGWMVLPERAGARRSSGSQQSLYISPPELSQIAAIEAFAATRRARSGEGALCRATASC